MRPRAPIAAAALALCGAVFALAPAPAEAQGSSGSGIASGHFSEVEAADFSKQIELALAARGAHVAIVFRTGRTRDKLPDGVNFTHGAFWVHQPIRAAGGEIFQGYVTYNLFHGDGEDLPKTQSYLATQFPYAFTVASAVDDVGVVIPTPEMQRRIRTLIASETYGALHEPDYSLISNPADGRFQNCTEFLLDVISAAAWETDDPVQIKANLGAHFEPTVIRAGALARLFGPMADERLRLADHRGAPVRTATYASLARFMMQHGLADEAFLLEIERTTLAASGHGGTSQPTMTSGD